MPLMFKEVIDWGDDLYILTGLKKNTEQGINI